MGGEYRGDEGRQTIGGIEAREKECGVKGSGEVVFRDRLDEEDMGVFRRRA